VLSIGFALVQTRKSQKKREKRAIFAILGVLRKKLQADMMRCGNAVRGQPLRSEQGLGRGYGFLKKTRRLEYAAAAFGCGTGTNPPRLAGVLQRKGFSNCLWQLL
jgi:hypothetical protein